MLNSMRLISGYPTSLFVERTGLSLNKILPKLDLAAQKGFIQLKCGNIILTKLGCDFQNDLLILFL